MKRFLRTTLFFSGLALLAGSALAQAMMPMMQATEAKMPVLPPRDPEADRLLAAVIKKLADANTLTVDFIPEQLEFDDQRSGGFRCAMARPNFYIIDTPPGPYNASTVVHNFCDGQFVGKINYFPSILAYRQPAQPEDFYYGTNSLVTFFFSLGVEFDPADPVWRRSVSIFDTNKEAYNRVVTTRYLGERRLNRMRVKVVEMKFNTPRQLVRQVFYIKDDLIMSLETSILGEKGGQGGFIQHFRNYKFDEAIPRDRFVYTIPKHFPTQTAEPVRLGEQAPEFQLPLNNGDEISLKELLKTRKAALIMTLDGEMGMMYGPDFFLPRMRLLQTMRDKFAKQGLEAVVIVGGKMVVPEKKEEILKNWLPDQSRFTYPIALDLDLERGMQGSAFNNFNLNGRNCILVDKDNRVVFASGDFQEMRINELALYQSLAQIGFAVSPLDLEQDDEAQ